MVTKFLIQANHFTEMDFNASEIFELKVRINYEWNRENVKCKKKTYTHMDSISRQGCKRTIFASSSS